MAVVRIDLEIAPDGTAKIVAVPSSRLRRAISLAELIAKPGTYYTVGDRIQIKRTGGGRPDGSR